jgi:hypothetical protein
MRAREHCAAWVNRIPRLIERKLLVNGRGKIDLKNVSDSQRVNEDVGDLLPGVREVGSSN